MLAEVTPDMPAWTDEIFGPVAPITRFGTDDEAVALANASRYGLVGARSTRARSSRGLAIAEPDQGRDGPYQRRHAQRRGDHPVRRHGLSGNGSRYGGEANLDTFTEWQWVTVRDEPPTFPF